MDSSSSHCSGAGHTKGLLRGGTGSKAVKWLVETSDGWDGEGQLIWESYSDVWDRTERTALKGHGGWVQVRGGGPCWKYYLYNVCRVTSVCRLSPVTNDKVSVVIFYIRLLISERSASHDPLRWRRLFPGRQSRYRKHCTEGRTPAKSPRSWSLYFDNVW